MCDCFIINNYIKLIGNTIFIEGKELTDIPNELKELLIETNPKITINDKRIIIDKWEYTGGKFKKTIRGYIHKFI